MKRLPLVLLLLAAFALGAGVATKLQTYPYVPDALNEPCGKSVFEWRVMANRIDTTPVPLNANFEIIKLEGEPKPQGLIVRAYLKPRNPKLVMPDSRHWQSFVSLLNATILDKVCPCFGMPDGPHGPPDIYLLTHIGNQLVSARHGGNCAVLKPDATRAEQLAAMAQVLSPPAAARP